MLLYICLTFLIDPHYLGNFLILLLQINKILQDFRETPPPAACTCPSISWGVKNYLPGFEACAGPLAAGVGPPSPGTAATASRQTSSPLGRPATTPPPAPQLAAPQRRPAGDAHLLDEADTCLTWVEKSVEYYNGKGLRSLPAVRLLYGAPDEETSILNLP